MSCLPCYIKSNRSPTPPAPAPLGTSIGTPRATRPIAGAEAGLSRKTSPVNRPGEGATNGTPQPADHRGQRKAVLCQQKRDPCSSTRRRLFAWACRLAPDSPCHTPPWTGRPSCDYLRRPRAGRLTGSRLSRFTLGPRRDRLYDHVSNLTPSRVWGIKLRISTPQVRPASLHHLLRVSVILGGERT